MSPIPAAAACGSVPARVATGSATGTGGLGGAAAEEAEETGACDACGATTAGIDEAEGLGLGCTEAAAGGGAATGRVLAEADGAEGALGVSDGDSSRM
jgi:hypothetical protein